MKENLRKLIIIPAYNESECIEKTIENIQKNAEDFDYIIINDCSTDNTREICEKRGFHIINLPINLGIGGAVQTGYLYGVRYGYDMAVQVDGDGQHDAAFLQKMADCLEETVADMVIVSRFIEKQGFQSTGARRIGIRFFTWLIRLMTGKTVTDPTSGLRMVNRKVMAEFAKDYPKDYPEPETAVTVLHCGMKIEEIPVVMKERAGGVSSISMKKSVYYMVKVSMAIIIERMRRRK